MTIKLLLNYGVGNYPKERIWPLSIIFEILDEDCSLILGVDDTANSVIVVAEAAHLKVINEQC